MSATIAAVPSDGRRIVRNTALLGAGSALRLVGGFATTLLITDLLGAQYGLLLGAQRFVDFFRLIALFGFNTPLIRAVASGRADAGEVLGSVLALRGLLAPIFALVAVAAAALSGYLPEHRWLVYVFVVVAIGYVGVETLRAYCESYERMERTAFLPVTRSALMLGGVSLVSWLGGGLVGVACVFLATQFLQLGILLGLSRSLLRRVRLSARRARMTALLREGPQYLLIGLGYTALRSINIVVLTRFSSVEEVSLYGAALNFVDVLFILPILAQRALLPAFSRDGGGRERVGSNGMYVFSGLLLPSAAGVYLLAESLVALYPSGQFSAAAPVLRTLALGIAFTALSSVSSTFLTGVGRVHAILRAYAVVLPVEAALCLLWVHEGATGVARGTIVAHALLCACVLFGASRAGLRIPWAGITRHALGAFAMGIAILPLRVLPLPIPVLAGVAAYALALLAICPPDSLERRLFAHLYGAGRTRLSGSSAAGGRAPGSEA